MVDHEQRRLCRLMVPVSAGRKNSARRTARKFLHASLSMVRTGAFTTVAYGLPEGPPEKVMGSM